MSEIYQFNCKELAPISKFKYRTLGISNECITPESVRYEHERKISKNYVMFYDIDKPISQIDTYSFDLIGSAFDNDIVLFTTRKGVHFVSFSLNLCGNTLQKAKDLSNELNEDYIFNLKFDYLTLRIRSKKDRATGEIHKKKPGFYEILKYPDKNSIVSAEHLRAYRKLGLPKHFIAYCYRNCTVREYETRYFFYLTNQ